MSGVIHSTFANYYSPKDFRRKSKAREEALQAIFMCDILGDWSEYQVALFYESFGYGGEVSIFSRSLFEGVRRNLKEIDEIIICSCEHWSIARMARVDRCLLRLAIEELTAYRQTPVKVIINEVLELAKAFGNENSVIFVNGVIDQVSRTLRNDM